MNKKYVLCAALGVALLVGLTGCSSKEPAKTQSPQQQSQLPAGHVPVDGQKPAGQTPTDGQAPAPAKPIDTKELSDKIYKLIDDKFPGDWKVDGTKLSKGTYTENDNFKIADEVGKTFPGSMISIFVGEQRISSTVKDQSGKPVMSGYPTPPAVGETIKSGKVTAGAPSGMGGVSYQKVYIPFKAGDKTVAVLSISVSQ